MSDRQAQYSGVGSESRGGVKTYFHSALKNTDVQTSSAQSVSAEKTYDAFGNVVSSTGSWKSPFSYAGKFGYQQDSDTGLKLLGHRYYDSSTGRFLTRDPIKDGRNWYSYCENNPVQRTDPNGLEWHDPTTVKVDEDFDGKVWVVGEPGPGEKQVFVQVMPGEESPSGMDVDIVIVQHKDGTQERYFVPGASPPQDGTDLPCYYTINEKGKVIPGPSVYWEWVSGTLPGLGRGVTYGVDYPVLKPKEFGKGWRGWYPGGNWNDDIEEAKKRRYRK